DIAAGQDEVVHESAAQGIVNGDVRLAADAAEPQDDLDAAIPVEVGCGNGDIRAGRNATECELRQRHAIDDTGSRDEGGPTAFRGFHEDDVAGAVAINIANRDAGTAVDGGGGDAGVGRQGGPVVDPDFAAGVQANNDVGVAVVGNVTDGEIEAVAEPGIGRE